MEPNPFAFSEFNSSYLLLDEVMKKLKNLSYTLGMISEELNISTTQINNYLDSYVVVPNLPLPESVGIVIKNDIFHMNFMRKISFLFILTNPIV